MQAAASKPRQPCTPQSQYQRGLQQGFVAVLLMVMIAMAAAAALTVNLWGGNASTLETTKTQLALKQAKNAVLNYVELGGNWENDLFVKIGGRLPCPNADGNGASISPCGGVNASYVGLLPWKTLGEPIIRDADGECLWLVVSSKFKVSSPTNATNADSDGYFNVVQPVKTTNASGNGWTWTDRYLVGDANNVVTNPTGPNRAVAVIIAPGRSIGNQNRTNSNNTICALPNATAAASASKFLDSYTSSDTTIGTAGVINNAVMPTAGNGKTFVQADSDHELLNDELTWITAEEFGRAASRRALRVVASAINNFVYGDALSGANVPGGTAGLGANGFYPWPAKFPGGKCDSSLLHGYVPAYCNTTEGGFGNWNLGSRMGSASGNSNDPEHWLSQIHYSVSAHCSIAPASKPTVVPTNVCLGGLNRLTVGADTASVHALLLIRGRDTTGACTTVTGVNSPPYPMTQPNLISCIDAANQAAITNTATANVSYVLPVLNSRNQMHLFKGQ